MLVQVLGGVAADLVGAVHCVYVEPVSEVENAGYEVSLIVVQVTVVLGAEYATTCHVPQAVP